MAEGGDVGNLENGSSEQRSIFMNQSVGEYRRGTMFSVNLAEDFELDELYDMESDSEDDETWKTSEADEKEKGVNLYTPPPSDMNSINELRESMMKLNVSGTVCKKILKGGGGVKPPEGSKVIFEYVAFLEGSQEFYDAATGRKTYQVLMDESCELLPGLKLAVGSMRYTEEAQFWIHWSMAFGELGCPPRMPREQCIFINIRFKRFISPDQLGSVRYMNRQERSNLKWEEIFEGASLLRLYANDQYGKKNYWGAVKNYRRAIEILEHFWKIKDDQVPERAKLLATCYCNMAICYIKLERGPQACTACKNGLDQPNELYKGKLFFRYAYAKLLLNGFAEALNFADLALKNGVDEELCQKLIAKIKGQRAYWATHEKEFAKKSLGF